MKEILTKLFGDAVTDDAMKQFNAELGKKFVAKADFNAKVEELKEKKTDFEKLNTEFEALKTANASGEEWKTKYEAIVAENEAKAKQAEADRILAEKNADTERRFNECVGDKKFSHDAIKASYLKKFADALDSEEYKGKGDAEIFHALTKDDATAFTGVTAVKLAGGRPQTVGKTYNTKDEIMAIKDSAERLNAIQSNPNLFRKE
jgi:hypothetical protein